MADLAARVGSDEKRLSRTIVRINTIEVDVAARDRRALRRERRCRPALVPSEPDAPDTAYEKLETRDRVRAAIQSLPWREQKVIGLYYYGEVTMKEIGAEIGVNESRVSQLHARAIRRLREALGEMGPQQVAEMRKALQSPSWREAGSDGEGSGDRQCQARRDAHGSRAAVQTGEQAEHARARRSRSAASRQAVAAAR